MMHSAAISQMLKYTAMFMDKLLFLRLIDTAFRAFCGFSSP